MKARPLARHHRHLTAAAALLLMILTSCGTGASSTPTSSAPINILYITTGSGPAAFTSALAQKLFQTAVDQWNSKGGILGRKVQLIIKDDGGTSANGAVILQEELTKEHIDWVYPGNDILTMGPILQSHKLLNSGLTYFPALQDETKYGYSFITVNFQSVYAQADIYSLTSLWHASKVAFIYATDGVELFFATFQSTIQSSTGISLVGSESITSNQIDTTPQLIKLRATNPDVLLVEAHPPTYGQVMKDLQKLGWKVPVLLAPGGSADAVSPVGIVGASALQGAVCMSYRDSLTPGGQVPAYNKPLLQQLRDSGYSTLTYPFRLYIFFWDAAQLVKVAFEGAQSTDPDKARHYLESLGAHYPSTNPFLQVLNFTPTRHGPEDRAGMVLVKCDQPLSGDGFYAFHANVPWPASMNVPGYPTS